METRFVTVGCIEYRIPGMFQIVDSEPDDPVGSIPLMTQTDQALCFVLAHPISADQCMPLDRETVIDAIRGFLQPNQGLIEVESGSTADFQYVYSIVKTLKSDAGHPAGVQYVLAMDVVSKAGVTHFQGFFDEAGTTGMRDAVVFEICKRDGLVGNADDPFEGWTADPYDAQWRSGALMKLSERRRFDAMFPAHPLSVARGFVACIVGSDRAEGIARGSEMVASEKRKEGKGTSLFEGAGKLFGGVARAASDTAGKVADAAGDVAGKVAHAAGDAAGAVADAAGEAGGKAATVASSAVTAVADVAGGAKDAIEEKIEEAKAAREEPDEYDKAVIAYNMAYTDLSDAGLDLHSQRVRAIDLIEHVEALVNSIANRPKSFDRDLGEVLTCKATFKEAESFARKELEAARASATSAGAGLAAGMAVASLAPSAALWVATTFGTASTGTAISALSGAAASQAALAWLGGGALAAGGGGTAAGSALLALAGPIGWGIAGATLLASIVLFTKKKLDLRDEKQKELAAVKENTEKVAEMAAEIGALLAKTTGLREKLDAQYGLCMAVYGADYMALSQGQQDGLAAMVNNTLTLSRLLNERLSQDGE